jgi:hypothetical protein
MTNADTALQQQLLYVRCGSERTSTPPAETPQSAS